jgi:ribosomal-protein-alanine N-acetyltransferase
VISGHGVYLRPASIGDFEEWSELRRSSQGFIAPWEPTWTEGDLSLTGFRRRLATQAAEIEDDRGYTFLLFRASDSRLFGQLSFGQVRRGAAQSAILGGWVGKQYSGSGLSLRALRVGLAFAFDALRLHRVEAATLPENRNSNHLLEFVGFKIEGFAKSYGKIGGRWRSHILWSMVEGDQIARKTRAAATPIATAL